MLKIFRSARKKIIKNNKTSTYIIYAIGEIILVMIGILLALQVNNWSENKRINENLNSYVIQLNEEIKANIIILNKVVEEETANSKDIDTIISIFKQKDFDNINLLVKSGSLLSFEEFHPVTTTFENLKSSGELKLIKDIKLRNVIFQAYNSFEKIKLVQDLHYYNMKTRAVDYFFNNAKFSDIQNSKPNFAKDVMFENIALTSASTISQIIDACNASLIQMEELKILLLTYQSENL
jgi:hypothetical protein